MDSAQLTADARNFLHAIDVDGDRAFFAQTNAQLLREAAFLDGRVPFAIDEPAAAPLSSMLTNAAPRTEPDRLIFNCSFSGSTFLSRMIDTPGKSLLLKEPRCLTEIAAWKIFNIAEGRHIERLDTILNFSLSALGRKFSPNEVVTIKVANQANALIDTITTNPKDVRPVFNTISRIDFLNAIFRGGDDRIDYAAQIAWHLAKIAPDGETRLRLVEDSSKDPLTRATRLILLALQLQIEIFRGAAEECGWGDDHMIDYSVISKSPCEAALQAAKVLDIDIDEQDIDRNFVRLSGQDAKNPDEPFSIDQQEKIHNHLHAEYGSAFEDAMVWAEKEWGSEQSSLLSA